MPLVALVVAAVVILIFKMVVNVAHDDAFVRLPGWSPRALAVKCMEADDGRQHIGLPRSVSSSSFRKDYLDRYSCVPKNHSLTVSASLHLLKMFGSDARIVLNDGRSIRVLDTLTDDVESKLAFGAPAMVKTAYGIRFPSERSVQDRRANESHRDQCLAELGRIQLPLSLPIRIHGQDYSLKDALQDSVANFHADQLELEWTTLAYLRYVAPVSRQWTNRFGQTFSFDDLAVQLMSRPLWRQSCGGVHSLIAMGTLYETDSEFQILSPGVRQRLSKALRRHVEATISGQSASGNWHPGWTIPFSGLQATDNNFVLYRTESASKAQFVLATGHACEWLMGLPDEFAVPSRALEQGAAWLRVQIDSSTADEQWKDFCPWSHANLVANAIECKAH